MSKIIVELCQNHQGDRKVLSELIRSAVENGADVVKGQIVFVEDLVPRDRFEEGEVLENGVQKTIKRPFAAEYDRLKKLDLTPEDYSFFVEEVQRLGAIPMLTIFSRKRIPLAKSLPWKGEAHIKVASFDCGSHKMIGELADHFDRIVVSTGASFDEEIQKTARLLKEKGRTPALLHCVTSYPNTLEMCNLARMNWLRQYAPEVGWSDHTLVERDGIKAAKVALALGADWIERHFTILPADQTKDGPISITPSLLRELRDFADLPIEERKRRLEKEVEEWRVMLGQETREMTHREMLNRDYYRGRFASFVDGEWAQNWGDKDAI